MYNDELYHYGVLGMKWGVRKAQNANENKRAQKKEFKLAQKTQGKGYRDSYDRMNDYRKKSRIVQKRSKELRSLSNKAQDLSIKLDNFESEEAIELAWKRASERSKKEVPGYSSMSEKEKYKLDEYYVFDGEELSKAVKETNRNNPEYQALQKEYKQTISAYKEKCKRITNEIIGKYGDTKISGIGTDMNYRELVYYSLSKPNGMWMFNYKEDMGRE